MLVDACSIASGADVSCDVCIVGAGAAGITIAQNLGDSHQSVVLLEGGGFEPNLASQRLYRGMNVGHPYFDIEACRLRYFGGSTNRWGGWLRPLDSIDFARHEWLDWSGWPISQADLRPYYNDAATMLGLSNPSFDLAAWQDRLGTPLELGNTNFQNAIFQYKALNFGEAYRANLVAARSVTVMLNANVTTIDIAEMSSRVEKLNISTLTGRQFTIRPKTVVLATGGIENARILLASRRDRPSGLGNEYDLVGRFFMEHLHIAAGHFVASSFQTRSSFYGRTPYKDMRVGGVVTPSPDALDRHKLLTTSITLEAASHSIGPQRMSAPSVVNSKILGTYQTATRGSLRPLAEGAKRAATGIANASRKVKTWKKARDARLRLNLLEASHRIFSLYFRSAQAPDPSSRVFLSTHRDSLGVPEAVLDWRVKSNDIAAIRAWIHLLDGDLRAKNLGLIIPPEDGWEQDITGGPHHMGTTRMSANVRRGVVNADCRVHSIDNLYVVGSSVFATGGYANPTFTIVALALRLAETLRASRH